MTRKRRKFSKEFKLETVKLVKEGPRSVGEVARDLDLTESAVRNWVRQFDVDASVREGLSTGELEELRQLRSENRQLRMERDILNAPDRGESVPNGEIFVDFVRTYPGPQGTRAWAQRVHFNNDPASPSFSTHIWVDTDNFENTIDHNLARGNMTRLMIHEILHALGMTAHVEGFDSIMNSRLGLDPNKHMRPLTETGWPLSTCWRSATPRIT